MASRSGRFGFLARDGQANLPDRKGRLLTLTNVGAIFPIGKKGRAMNVIDTPGRFGGLIRSRRQALGMTQRDLALAVNVGERFIVDLESGKPTCQLGKALAVARGVGIRLVHDAPVPSADTRPGPGGAYPDLPDLGDGA